MNRIFKVIWSKVKNCYVVVSEVTKSVGRGNTHSNTCGGSFRAVLCAMLLTGNIGFLVGNVHAVNNPGTGLGVAWGPYSEAPHIHNVAIGAHSKATGDNSLTIGLHSNATAEYASAIGQGAAASATNALAVGAHANTSGENAVAVGASTSSTGKNSVAVGPDAVATQENSTAIGALAKAKGAQALAEGALAEADGAYASAIGGGAKAKNTWAVAIGALSTSSGEGSMAMGNNSNASGNLAYAIGGGSNAQGKSSYSIGTNTAVTGEASYAIGQSANVTAGFAYAIGGEAKSSANYGMAIGTHAKVEGEHGVAVGTWSQATKSKAFAGGYAALAKAENGIAVGYDAQTDGGQGIAVGSGSRAKGDNSIAEGVGAKGYAKDGIAIGNNAESGTENNKDPRISTLASNNGVAVGNYARARGGSSVSVGNDSFGNGPSSVAIGNAAWANDIRTIAIGNNAHAEGSGALAIGREASALTLGTGTNPLVSGTDAVLDKKGVMVIGDDAIASGNNSIAFGTSAKVGDLERTRKVGKSQGGNENLITELKSKTAVVDGVAIGTSASTQMNEGIAIGKNSFANGLQGTAIGSGAKVNQKYAVALGAGSETAAVVTSPKGNINGNDYTFAGGNPQSTVSVGKVSNERTITNVAAGRINSSSTDAINGSQLQAVITEVNKGTNFKGDDTNVINKKLGQQLDIKGGADTTKLSNNNIGVISNNGTLDVKLAKELKGLTSVTTGTTVMNDTGLTITGGPKVVKTGIDAGSKVITNVASGGDVTTNAANIGDIVRKDKYITGGTVTYQTNGNGTANLTGSNGLTASVTGLKNTYVTKGTVSNDGKTLTLERNDASKFNVDLTKTISAASSDHYLIPNPAPGSNGAYKPDGSGNLTLTVAKPDGSDAKQIKLTDIASKAQQTTNTTNINKNTTEINKGLNFKGDDATVINKKLGQQLDIKGGAGVANLTENNIGVVSDNGALKVKLNKDINLGNTGSVTTGATVMNNTGLSVGGKTYVSNAGLNANSQKITNVAKGVVNSDAVNLGQLKEYTDGVAAKVTTVKAKDANVTVVEGNNAAGGKEYTIGLGNKVTLGTAADKTIIVDGVNGTIKAGNKVTVNGTTGDIQAGTVKITGAGTVNELTNRTWNIDNPVIVHGQAATEDQLKVVSDGVKTNKTDITTINNTIGQGLNFKGDDTTVINKKLGQQLDIKGGADAAKLSDNNIGVVSDMTGALNIKLSKELKGLTSVTTGDTVMNTNGLTITGGPSVTKTGINAGGNKITGVADGEVSATSKEAVNGSQLHKVTTGLVDKGFGIKAEDGNKVHKKLGEDIEVTGDGKNISTKVENGKVQVTMKDDISLTSVTTGDTVMNTNGLTIAGGPSITKTGIDAGNKRITNVATGVAGTDAVNVDQLKSEIAANKTVLTDGKNTTVTGTGTSVNPYRVHVKDDLVLGEKGAAGKDGSLGINGKDGSSVFINGKDGSIGMNGKDGKDGLTMKSQNGQNGVDGTDGHNGTDGMTRIVYEDHNHVTHEVATLDDGLKFAGNTGEVAKKLNTTMTIKGTGAKADSEYDTSNIKTRVNDNGEMLIGLDRNLKVDSVATGKTVINNSGLTIQNGPSITENGVDAGGKQITNVAPGRADTDAVNVSQLKQIGGNINRLDNRISRVGAGAAALAALHPLDFDPDEKWDFAAGYGNYNGANAVAVGAFYRPNEDTMLSVGGSFGGGENMVNAGLSMKVGQGNHISTSRVAMAKEIKDLRAELEHMKSSLVKVADGKKLDSLDMNKMQLFPDIPENHWAYDYVATLAGNGIIVGYPDGQYLGDRMMTRYEMAALIYRAMQNGALADDNMARALREFKPELERIRVDTITKNANGTPDIQRVRVIKGRG